MDCRIDCDPWFMWPQPHSDDVSRYHDPEELRVCRLKDGQACPQLALSVIKKDDM